MDNQPVYGELTIAAYIYQYDGDELIGYSMVDFEIFMIDEDDNECTLQPKAALNPNNSFHVNADEERSVKVLAEVTGLEEDFSLEAFTELDSIPEADFDFETYDSTANIKVGIITIKNTGSIVRSNPYNITVRAAYDDHFQLHKDVVFLLYTTADELPPLLVLGVEERGITLEAYPNPVKDYLTLRGNIHPLTSARLLTASGIPLCELPFSKDAIDFRSVGEGFYLLQVTFGTRQMKTIKTVKIKH